MVSRSKIGSIAGLLLLVGAVTLALSVSRCGPRKSQLMTEGERLYRSKCRGCHHVIAPEKYNDNEWVMNIEWMGPLTGLETKEAELILEYLQSANGDVRKPQPKDVHEPRSNDEN